MGEPHFSPVWGRKSLVYKIGKMSSQWNICDSRKDKKSEPRSIKCFPQSSVHIVLHGSSSARVLNRAAFIPDRQTAVCLHCPLLTERSNNIPHPNSPCQSWSFYLREQSMCGRRGIYYYIKSICNSSLRGILFGLGWMWDGFLLSGDKWAVSWSLLQTGPGDKSLKTAEGRKICASMVSWLKLHVGSQRTLREFGATATSLFPFIFKGGCVWETALNAEDAAALHPVCNVLFAFKRKWKSCQTGFFVCTSAPKSMQMVQVPCKTCICKTNKQKKSVLVLFH